MRHYLAILCLTLLSLGGLPQLAHADDFVPNSFDEVTPHLDKGGDLYFYISTDDFVNWGGDKLAEMREIAVDTVEAQEGSEAADQVDGAYTVLLKIYEDGGLRDISGFGISSIKTSDTNYRTKAFIHTPTGKGPAKLLNMYGQKAHPLTALNLLPRNTVLASNSDFDAGMMWLWLNDLILASNGPNWLQSWNGALDMGRQMGVDADAIVDSMAGEFTMIVTMNPRRRVQIPMGKGDVLEIGEPAVAVVIKVKDSTIFDLIDTKLTEFEVPLTKVDQDAIKMRLIQVGGNAPFKALPVIAQVDGHLILASSDDLVMDIANTLRGRVPGIAKSAEFAAWSKDMPTTGNSFVLITPALTRTIADVKDAIVDQMADDADAEQFQSVLDSIMSGEVTYTYQVTARLDDGFLAVTNSSQSGANMMLSQFVVAPGALLAGALLPTLSTARGKAQRVNSAGNMKQFGLACLMYSGDNGGAFPKPDGAAALDLLNKEDILDHGKVHYNPRDKRPRVYVGYEDTITEEYTSYAYIGAGLRDDHDNATSMPIMFEKPIAGDGWINVLFIDGHVQGYSYDGMTLEGFVKDVLHPRYRYSDSELDLLLRKCRAMDKAIAAEKH